MKLKRDKCSFLLPAVEFLGHHISAKGIQPTTQKVDAIHSAPESKDVTQLKSFLGTVDYYGKFLPDLSTVLAPLYQLLQKNTKWFCGLRQTKVFESVKKLLTSDKVLVHYDPTKELVLACDASPYGVGAVLLDPDRDGKDRPIAYASRSIATAKGTMHSWRKRD